MKHLSLALSLVVTVCLACSNYSQTESHLYSVTIEKAPETFIDDLIIQVYDGKNSKSYKTSLPENIIALEDSSFTSHVLITLSSSKYNDQFVIYPGTQSKITLLEDSGFDYKSADRLFDLGLSEFQNQVSPKEKELQSFFSYNNDAIQAGDADAQKQLDQIMDDLNSSRVQFIEENPKSYYAFKVFKDNLLQSSVDDDVLIELFETSFPEKLKESYEGQQVERYINGKRLKTGVDVPKFEATTIEGELISFTSNSIEEATLIVFWATWCNFCQAEVPVLKSIRDDFSTEKLNMITVSLDWDEQQFIDGVTNHEMDWNHVYGRRDIAYDYGFASLPAFVLIGADGKIALKEEALREDQIDRLIETLETETGGI